jgi:hypothetical protein
VRKNVKRKGIARKHVGTLEGSKVGSLGRGVYTHPRGDEKSA